MAQPTHAPGKHPGPFVGGFTAPAPKTKPAFKAGTEDSDDDEDPYPRIEPIPLAPGEEDLNAFDNAKKYFTYWLHKLDNPPEEAIELHRNGKDRDWGILMSKRNSASFISQYIYNRGLMKKLEKIPEHHDILTRATYYFQERDSRTGIPGIMATLGKPVPGTPFENYYKGAPGSEPVVWEIPTLPGCDGPIGYDMPPTPEDDE